MGKIIALSRNQQNTKLEGDIGFVLLHWFQDPAPNVHSTLGSADLKCGCTVKNMNCTIRRVELWNVTMCKISWTICEPIFWRCLHGQWRQPCYTLCNSACCIPNAGRFLLKGTRHSCYLAAGFQFLVRGCALCCAMCLFQVQVMWHVSTT